MTGPSRGDGVPATGPLLPTLPSAPPAQRERYWEIDLLRGIAIIMMVIFHLMWDLSYFGVLDVDVYTGFWRTFQRATASLFLVLVGVSLHVSTMHRLLAGHSSGLALFGYLARRGLTIFLWGMVITALTWLVIPNAFVIFGILHLIGTSVVLSFPFLRLGVWNIIPAVVLLVAGDTVRSLRVDIPWLVWLGLLPPNFASVDYFPLVPWFGVILLGLAIGAAAYTPAGRRFAPPPLGDLAPARLLRLLGRYSLVIYLLHQPALLAILIITGIVNIGALL